MYPEFSSKERSMAPETQLLCLEFELHNCITLTHRASHMCVGAAVVEGKRREEGNTSCFYRQFSPLAQGVGL